MKKEPNLSYGHNNQIQFKDTPEFYFFLGYLACNKGYTSINWEHNKDQGAWGNEGRIHFYVQTPIPPITNLNHTAGTGKIISRVNCNDYIEYIIKNHNFQCGDRQDIDAIIETIPTEYISDFQRGLNYVD